MDNVGKLKAVLTIKSKKIRMSYLTAINEYFLSILANTVLEEGNEVSTDMKEASVYYLQIMYSFWKTSENQPNMY